MIRSVDTETEVSHQVLLFPSYAGLSDDGQSWRVHVLGAIYEMGEIKLRTRLLLRLLRRVLNVDPEELDSEIFRRRIEAFVGTTEKGKRVRVRIGDRIIRTSKGCRRNGRFSLTMRLTAEEVVALREQGHLVENELRVGVSLCGINNGNPLPGRVHLLEPTGVSIVSDIDDTIKHTQVHSRRELLANTFLREFRCVDGMADVYRQLADRGAAFHYVSSSPWQLFPPLAHLCEQAGFPAGTFHLRNFRLRDHMLRRVFIIRRKGKSAEIRALIDAFPRRRFILVGDSGERDPEIYGKLACRNPRQVLGVFIRQLPDRPLDAERQRRLMAQLPAGTFQLFDQPDQLRASCQKILELREPYRT